MSRAHRKNYTMTVESNPDRIEFFTAQSGHESAKVVYADGSLHHIHSLVAPEKEHEYTGSIDVWGDIVILEGTGLGYQLEGSTRNLGNARVIIAIDAHPEVLGKFTARFQEKIAPPVITVAAAQDTERLCDAIPSGSQFRVQIIRHWASYTVSPGFYDSLTRRVVEQLPRKPRGTSSPPRALLLKGSFFLESELQRALRRVYSEEPIIFDYKATGGLQDFSSVLQKSIQNDHPDVILSVNMKGFDGNGVLGRVTERSGIPVVVWFVDDPHPIMLHQAQFVRSNMIAFCWERSYLPFLEKFPFSSVHHLPLASDEMIFPFAPQQGPEIPVGFVGSAMQGDFLYSIRQKFLWKAELAPLVEKAATRLLDSREHRPAEILLQTARDLEIDLPFTDSRNVSWLVSYMIHTASMMKRRMVLGGIANSSLQTFGDPEGWSALLGKKGRHNPPLDYQNELATVYRNIAVNINITSCQMATAVNQRVFDVPSCGGFLLSDNQADMEELFEIGTEAAVYGSAEEAREKAGYYLAHEAERRAVIQKARERIDRQHRYHHRIQRIMNALHA